MRKYFILSFTFKEDKSLTRGDQLNSVSEPGLGGVHCICITQLEIEWKENIG